MRSHVSRAAPEQVLAIRVSLACLASEVVRSKAQNLREASTPAPSGGLGEAEQQAINDLLTVLGLIISPILLGLLVGAWRYRRSLYKILPEVNLSNKVSDRERKIFKQAELKKLQHEELRTAATAPVESPGPIPIPAEPAKDLGAMNDVEAFFRSDEVEDEDRSVFAQSSKASASTESLEGARNELDESFGSRGSRRNGSKASSNASKAALIASYARSRPQSEISEGSLDHAAVHPDPGGPAPPVSSLGKDFLRLPDESGRVARKPRAGSKQSTGSRKVEGKPRSGSKGSNRSASKEAPAAEGEVKRKGRRLLTS